MLTSPLDSTLLPRYSNHLLSQDSRTLCRCYSVLLHEDGTEPMPRNTATVLSSPACPANKGCSQASKLRSRGDLFRRCDASGQRQLRTKTPTRLGGTGIFNPSGLDRPEIQRGIAPFVGVLAHFTRTHGATVQAELGVDAKGTMTSIDVLPTEAFKWSEHAPLRIPFPSRPEHWVEVRSVLDEFA
jgi:hypothetical protein